MMRRVFWLLFALAVPPAVDPPAVRATAGPAQSAKATTPTDLRAGRRLHLAYDSGPCFAPSASGWVLDKPGAELCGDGVTGEDVGLRYWTDPSVPELRGTGNSTILRIAASQLYVHDLVLSNDRGPVAGTGDAIVFEGPTTICCVKLERVSALYAGRNCLRLAGNGDRQLYTVEFSLRDCNFFGASGDGVFVDTATAMDWSNVVSMRHKGRGFVFRNIESSRLKLVAESVAGGILMQGSSGCMLDSPHLEDFAGTGESPAPGIVLDGCRGVTIGSGAFNDYSGRKPVSIRLVNGCTRCTVQSSAHAGVGVAVECTDPSCHDNTIFGQEGAALRVDRTRNRVIE